MIYILKPNKDSCDLTNYMLKQNCDFCLQEAGCLAVRTLLNKRPDLIQTVEDEMDGPVYPSLSDAER